jgi:threonine synthase
LTGEDVDREIAELEESTISDKDAIAYIEAHYDVRAPEMIRELFEKEIVNEEIINKEEIKDKIVEFIKN